MMNAVIAAKMYEIATPASRREFASSRPRQEARRTTSSIVSVAPTNDATGTAAYRIASADAVATMAMTAPRPAPDDTPRM